ncbi:MAG: hypothetical protein HY796_05785 [Elusimicrobia bacterium]|nr:hypothetical protein [Elusimicrobiota bacterium]
MLIESGRFDNVEDSLAHVLAFVVQKIPAAEVIAVLPEGCGEGPAVRLAWRKNMRRPD